MRYSQRGFILVIVLVILSITTAFVVEFSYGVYATTSNLKNWTESQRLSLISLSGVRLAAKALTEQARVFRYTYPEKVEMPLNGVIDGFDGRLFVKIEDEGGKINLNSLIMSNKRLNMDVYGSLKRILKVLNLDESIADSIVDWIDEDSEPRVRDSEDDAKNGPFDSLDEILLIKGIDREVYEKLVPHLTIYGNTDRMMVNINTATIPVIMSLNDAITEEMAGAVVRQRRFKPFEGTADTELTAILGPLKTPLMGKIDVKSYFFRVIAMAEEDGIKRQIDSVLEVKGEVIVRYWKEI